MLRQRRSLLRSIDLDLFCAGPPKRWHGTASNKAAAAAAAAGAAGDKGSLESRLTYPTPPSTQHSDLATFLDYARRTGLDEKSTVYVGTHYEYSVAAALSKYGFFLKRIGGASDRGTDLVGTWTPSPQDQPLRVLVQCKAGAQGVGPKHVRELEGAFGGAPVGWRGAGVLGLLVSERAATKGVFDSLRRSIWPLAYLCCSRTGAVTQMLWNQQAEKDGLEGYGVAAWHAPGFSTPKLVLTRDGEPMDQTRMDAGVGAL